MKTNCFKYILLTIGVLLGFNSCLNEDPWADWDSVVPVIELPYTNHVLTKTNVVPGQTLTFDLMVNYTIADKKNNKEDITVTLAADEALVANYNRDNASSYVYLTAGYNMPTMTIAKGTQLTKQEFAINTTGLDNTKDYILPVVIKSVSPEHIISGNFNVVYLRIQMKKN